MESVKTVIGIGCSAGGLEILRHIVGSLKPLGESCVVIVQHMAASSKSMLTDILARDTSIPIHRATDGLPLMPGNIYVSIPNADLTIQAGHFKLVSLEHRVGPKPSIDKLFTSLAENYGEHVLGIILSGTGTDGSYGIKSVKVAGGLTVAQKPGTAKYDGMPLSALATGLVDFIWDPDKIVSELNQINQLMTGKNILESPKDDSPDRRSAYERIFDHMRLKTKVDFSQYKPKSLERRINRRVLATESKSLDDYADYLESQDNEWRSLFHTILISVTSFFRDDDEFKAVRKAMVDYVQKNRETNSLRIWSAGCSSGEEPYSLLIMLLEILEELNLQDKIQVQVFATDIQDEVMAEGRKGFFSAAAVESIDTQLIDKYFDRSESGYVIKKRIRELVLFAKHDLAKNPPFLRIDLIVCRNVFIYFEPEVQERIIQVFHYALNPSGILFMGKSESIAANQSTFHHTDQSAKVFIKNNKSSPHSVTFSAFTKKTQVKPSSSSHSKQFSYFENLKEIVGVLFPNSFMVDENFQVVSVYGIARQLVHFPEGTFTLSFENLLISTYKNKILTLLSRCRRAENKAEFEQRNETVIKDLLNPEDNTKAHYRVSIKSFAKFERTTYIIHLSEIKERSEVAQTEARSTLSDQTVSELELELNATREHLQTVIEDQETANEELQALNEEMQSANEELQSTNEELETSNEELQSTNEELTTVNEELNTKTVQLNELYAYLQDIQDGIPVPTIVIDEGFCLKRYNPAAKKLLGIQSNWTNKNLRYLDVELDLTVVWVTIEDSVKRHKSLGGFIDTGERQLSFYSHPIFTSDGVINAVVVTFVETTSLSSELADAKDKLKLLETILNDLPVKVSAKNARGNYVFANDAFAKALKKAKDEIVGNNDEAVLGLEAGQRVRSLDFEALKQKAPLYNEEQSIDDKGQRQIFQNIRVPSNPHNLEPGAISSISVDISHRDFSERQLRNFETLIRNNHDSFLVFERRKHSYVLVFGENLISELIGEDIGITPHIDLANCMEKLCHKLDPKDIASLTNNLVSKSLFNMSFERLKLPNIIKHYTMRSILLDDHDPHQLLITISDMTSEVDKRHLLQVQQDELLKTAKMASLGEMAAGIAHELKTPLNTIQGYVDLINTLADQGSDLSPPMRSAVQNIEDTVSRISEIIVGLKSITKNRDRDSFQPFSLLEIINEVIKICSFHLKNKGIKLEVDVSEEIFIDCRPTQISQVLINLINNSADAIENQTRGRWIQLKSEIKGNELELSIKDSGSGIAEAVANQIMTPFFTTKPEGTGLGLSLSRNILKAHGGELTYVREEPSTTFKINLPVFVGQ